jgi:hypothetical protein
MIIKIISLIVYALILLLVTCLFIAAFIEFYIQKKAIKEEKKVEDNYQIRQKIANEIADYVHTHGFYNVFHELHNICFRKETNNWFYELDVLHIELIGNEKCEAILILSDDIVNKCIIDNSSENLEIILSNNFDK